MRQELIVELNYKKGLINFYDDFDDLIEGFEFEPMSDKSVDFDTEGAKEILSDFFKNSQSLVTLRIVSYKGEEIRELELEDVISSFSELVKLIEEGSVEYEAFEGEKQSKKKLEELTNKKNSLKENETVEPGIGQGIKPYKLKEGEKYTWFMGMEPMECTFLKEDIKNGRTVFVFKVKEGSINALSMRDVRDFIFPISIFEEYKKEVLKETLSTIPPKGSKTIDIENLRAAIIAELDAINLYEQMANSSSNENVKTVLLDISREEKTHVGELQSLLKKLDAEYEKELIQGEKEIENLKENNVSFWKDPFLKKETYTVVSYSRKEGKYGIEGDFEAINDMDAISQARNSANPEHRRFEAFVANSKELEEFIDENNFTE